MKRGSLFLKEIKYYIYLQQDLQFEYIYESKLSKLEVCCSQEDFTFGVPLDLTLKVLSLEFSEGLGDPARSAWSAHLLQALSALSRDELALSYAKPR